MKNEKDPRKNFVAINRQNLYMPKSLRKVLIDLDTLAVKIQLRERDAETLQENDEPV